MSNVMVMLSTYNGAKYLEKQLNSIYAQETQHNIKVLVRDDGSTDSTLRILHGWNEKLNLELIEDNKKMGPAKSFMELLSCAPEEDYYAFVDQDDEWDLSKIQHAVETIGDTTERVLWFSNCRIIDGNSQLVEPTLHKKPPILNMVSQLICGSSQGCSMVFNQAMCDYIKGLKLYNYFMHDQVVMEYALAVGKVIYDDTPYFSYRVHSNNVIAKDGKSIWKRAKDTICLWFGEENKYKLSLFADEVLSNVGDSMDDDTKRYFKELKNCKHSFRSRLYIINSPLTNSTMPKAVRSFKLKVLLGVI